MKRKPVPAARRPDDAPAHEPLVDSRMSVRTLLPLVGWLRTRGADVNALLQRAGVDAAALFARDAWIARGPFMALWAEGAKLFPGERVGLSVLAFADVRLLDTLQFESGFIVPQLVAASATVGEAIELLRRFYPVTHGASRLTLTASPADDDTVDLTLHQPDDLTPPAFAEFTLGLLASLLAACATEPLDLRRVRFAHAGPGGGGEADYARVLGAPVQFDAGRHALTLGRGTLRMPLKTRDFLRLEQVVAAAEALRARKAADTTVAARARALLAIAVRGGDPSVEATARALALSVRHLTRRLGDEGTSHRALVDEARAGHARALLLDPAVSLDDIPALVGYSDASAFRRAFRRWFGCSPSALREGAAGRDPSP